MHSRSFFANGWTPQLAVVPHGERRVHQVVGWLGGSGVVPALGLYVGAAGLVADLALATDIRGTQGLAGAAALVGTYVAAVPLLRGQPVVVSRASGLLAPGDALIYTQAFVIGLASEAVAAGFAAQVVDGRFDMPDWTALTGAALLAPGVPYFLAAGGGLTADRPQAPWAALNIVGLATAPTVLQVRPSFPIQL